MKLVDSSSESHKIDSNNYSQDDEKHTNGIISKKKIDIIKNQNSVEDFTPYDNDDDKENESIDNELKELEKDEKDILFLMKQIKNYNIKS